MAKVRKISDDILLGTRFIELGKSHEINKTRLSSVSQGQALSQEIKSLNKKTTETSRTIYYGKSSSESIEPNNWDTTYTFESGKWLWIKEVITYADGSASSYVSSKTYMSSGSATCTSTIQYYMGLDSITTPPSEASYWKDDTTTWFYGYYVWKRFKYTWSDQSITYSNASYDDFTTSALNNTACFDFTVSSETYTKNLRSTEKNYIRITRRLVGFGSLDLTFSPGLINEQLVIAQNNTAKQVKLTMSATYTMPDGTTKPLSYSFTFLPIDETQYKTYLGTYASAPTGAVYLTGDSYTNSTDGKVYAYNGSSWAVVTEQTEGYQQILLDAMQDVFSLSSVHDDVKALYGYFRNVIAKYIGTQEITLYDDEDGNKGSIHSSGYEKGTIEKELTQATAYSDSSTYDVGAIVVYNKVYYKCKEAITTAEPFNSEHWNEIVKGFYIDNNGDAEFYKASMFDATINNAVLTDAKLYGQLNSPTLITQLENAVGDSYTSNAIGGDIYWSWSEAYNTVGNSATDNAISSINGASGSTTYNEVLQITSESERTSARSILSQSGITGTTSYQSSACPVPCSNVKISGTSVKKTASSLAGSSTKTSYIQYSTDGSSWSNYSSALSLAKNGTLYVRHNIDTSNVNVGNYKSASAIGSWGTVYESDVTYMNGYFYRTRNESNTSYCDRSANGITWTNLSTITASNITQVICAYKGYLLVNGFRSTDGITWTSSEGFTSAGIVNGYLVIFNGTNFKISSDGLTFTTKGSKSNSGSYLGYSSSCIFDIPYGYGQVKISTDYGVSWTSSGTYFKGDQGCKPCSAKGYDSSTKSTTTPNYAYISDYDTTGKLYRLSYTNGTFQQSVVSHPFSSVSLSSLSVAYNNGVWIMTVCSSSSGNSSGIAYSTDGLTFTSIVKYSTSGSSATNCSAYGNGLFLISGRNSSSQTYGVYYDTLYWSNFTTSQNGTLSATYDYSSYSVGINFLNSDRTKVGTMTSSGYTNTNFSAYASDSTVIVNNSKTSITTSSAYRTYQGMLKSGTEVASGSVGSFASFSMTYQQAGGSATSVTDVASITWGNGYMTVVTRGGTAITLTSSTPLVSLSVAFTQMALYMGNHTLSLYPREKDDAGTSVKGTVNIGTSDNPYNEIYGKDIIVSKNVSNVDTKVTTTKGSVSCFLGVGSDGVNHGVYSNTLGKWLIYGDASTVTVNGNCTGNANTSSSCTGNSATATKTKIVQNNYDSRPASMNVLLGDGSMRKFVATSSTTTGKPPVDAHIIHLAWDNTGGYDSQIAVANSTGYVYTRGMSAGTWTAWKQVYPAVFN